MNLLRSIRVSLVISTALLPLRVHAQAPATPTPTLAKPAESRLFDFPGGTPTEFISAVDKIFGGDWAQIAAIPEKAREVRIPPMRMRVATAQEVLNVANKLTSGNRNLGIWFPISGDPSRQGAVSALSYHLADSSPSPPALEVRAISLRDVPGGKWEELVNLLEESIAEVLPPAARHIDGRALVNIRIHRTAAMLMITAPKESIERIEPLAIALRTGMALPPGTSEGFAASQLVPLPGVTANQAKNVEELLGQATNAWIQAQEEQGVKFDRHLRFNYLDNLRGILLVGPREWITFAEQVAGEWAARQADKEAPALVEEVKARAFSIAGLPSDTVKRIVQEVDVNARKLRDIQTELGLQTGRAPGGGVLIYGQPQSVEGLQVLLVTGNHAGLEFARSIVEEARAGLEKSANAVKYVTVGGQVRAPNRMVWTEDLTVLGAISTSGGLTEFAKDTVRLTRGGETLALSRTEMSKDPKKDVRLQPGDRLEVQ